MSTSSGKRVGFLRKKAGTSKEQFLSHWQTTHAELCKRLPGLRRYAINFIDRERFPDAAYDGFSELWFDSEEALNAALASPEGRTLLADLPNFTDEIVGVVAEEQRIIWP